METYPLLLQLNMHQIVHGKQPWWHINRRSILMNLHVCVVASSRCSRTYVIRQDQIGHIICQLGLAGYEEEENAQDDPFIATEGFDGEDANT
jgi:hypothetical protein